MLQNTLPNQFPEPPLDMVMPPVYEQMMIANYVVLALVMVWILKEARRTGSVVPVMLWSAGWSQR